MGRLLTLTASLTLAVASFGCDGDSSPGHTPPPSGPVDSTLAVDTGRIRISAPSDDGRIVVAGLPGAAAAGRTVRLSAAGGAILAEVPRAADGSFVLEAPHGDGTLQVRALDGDRVGPQRTVTIPEPAGRPINPALVSAALQGAQVQVRGVVGAAPPERLVVVTSGGSATEVLSDAGGNFAALMPAAAEVVTFLSGSPPVPIVAAAGDLPVLVSASGGAEEPAVVVGAPGSLANGQVVTVAAGAPIASGLAGPAGAFGVCFTGASPGAALQIGSAARVVPSDPGLPPLWSALTVTAEGGALSIDGPGLGAVEQVVAVNCATGQWTASPAGSAVALLLDGGPSDVLALVGVGGSGAVGAVELVEAGTGQRITAPLASPDPERVVHSAVVDGQVLVAGLPGAVPPGASVRVGEQRVTASDDGAFAARVSVGAGTSLTVQRVAGPLTSAGVSLLLSPPSSLALPPVAARITATMDGERAEVRGPASTGLVALNLVRRTAAAAMTVGTRFQARLDADPGHELYVFRAERLGAPAGSAWVTRRAAAFDVPLLVSAAGPHACAAAPLGAETVDTVTAVSGSNSTPITPVRHDSGSLAVTFGGIAAQRLELEAPGGDTARDVPLSRTLDLAELSVTVHDGAIRVGSGGLDAGPEWIFALATADGRVAVVEPTQAAPWTLVTPLAPSPRVDLFAVHRPTGEASRCRRVEWTVEPDPPVLLGVTPAPLVVGGPLEITGLALAPAPLVSIGGVEQAVQGSPSLLTGTVAEGTPAGTQILAVSTTAGVATLPVEVVLPPAIAAVQPTPLVAGKSALVTGSAFGTAPTVSLSNVPQVVLAASPSTIEVRVSPKTPAGAHNLRVSNGFASHNVTVEVVCLPPVIDAVTSPVLLGDTVLITGDHLLGAAVAVGGVPQSLTAQTDVALELTLAPGTPLGAQPLTVTGACGQAQTTLAITTEAPVITGTNPALAVRGQPLNVQGDHLAGAAVTIGGVAQALIIDSKKGLTLVVSAQTPLGAQTLQVTTGGGVAETLVQVASPPSVTAVEPQPLVVGQPLAISGEHLTDAVVTLAGVPLSLTEGTDGALAAVVPSVTPPGLRELIVTTPGGSATVVVEVVGPPVIVQILPDPANLTKPLLVSGDNLAGAQVTIGGVAQEVVSAITSQVVLTVGAATPIGAQELVVVTPGGTTSAMILVIEGPLIGAVTPAPLVIGGALTVTGTRLAQGEVTVTIGGVVQPLGSSADTLLQGTVASGTPNGPQWLRVTTDDGSDEAEVTVLTPPKLTGALPDPVLAGATLTLIGTGLGEATVSLAGLAAPVTTPGDTSLKIAVPPATPPGVTTVVVTTPGGTASREVGVLAPPPKLTSAAPSPLQAGAPVVLTGQWLLEASVTIGGLTAPVTKNAWDAVTAEVPGAVPLGGSVQVVVTTPGGTAQLSVAVVASSAGAPWITQVQPSEFAVGAVVEIVGTALKGGTVTIGGLAQPVLTTTPTSITFSVKEGTKLGSQSLLVKTMVGQAAASVTVVPPAPVVTDALPSPITVGDTLTVTGAHLSDFTSVTIGGVKQLQFFEISDVTLTFRVAKGTPDGEAIDLVVTGPGGFSVYPVDVLPKPPTEPTITSVNPTEIAPGQILTVFGAALDEATFTLGGVPHTPVPGGSGAQVKLTVSTLVAPGFQALVASNGDLPPATADVYIKPGPPLAGRVFLSAVDSGDAVIAAQPGAVAADALVNLTLGDQIATVTASPLGSFSAVLSALGFQVSPGHSLVIEQIVDGGLSPPLTLTLGLPSPAAPDLPHPFLLRVESVGPDVLVYGPAPTFGAPGTTIVAVAGAVSGILKASALHADPFHGIFLPGGASADAIHLFAVAGGKASAPLITFPGAFDPPLLSSAVVDGAVCVAGLPGTVVGKLSVDLRHPDGGAVGKSAFTASAGGEGAFAARAQVFSSAGLGPFVWEGTVGPHAWSAVAPAGGPAAPPVNITAQGDTVAVTASGLADAVLLVVASPSGDAAAGFGAVSLETADDAVFVWTVPLDGSPPSGCALHSL